jgi:uncharacterized protein
MLGYIAGFAAQLASGGLLGGLDEQQSSRGIRCGVSVNARDLSVGVFVRGLTNLKMQLMKAEAHVASSGADEATLLDARLAQDARAGDAGHAPYDLHTYTLAAHVHWAAEGARLAIEQVLGARPTPVANDAKSFSDLHQRIGATIAYLQETAMTGLEAGLDRPIVLEHRRGTISSNGGQFLLAFAIPHFFYHVTTVYGILRSQGVRLTMGDFLGEWGTT